MTKKCSRCKIEKDIKSFNKSKNAPLGIHNQCRECIKLWKPSETQLKKYREKIKNWNRFKYSGFTQEDFNAKFAEQNYCCAICGTDESGAVDWHADHNHISKAKRGILCHKCNTGIGLLKDSPDILKKAIMYLEKYES
jgi:DNA-directed RNA polymerase subunit RPC12/RpoP